MTRMFIDHLRRYIKLLRVPENFLLPWVALGAACLVAMTVGATTKDSPSPRDQLAVWAGHWKIRIETKETQFGHVRTDYFDAKCAFLPHGGFMFCDYLSLQPNAKTGRILDDISLIYYSDVDKTFKYTNVAPEGGPSENSMQVDGNVWTRPFEIQMRSGGAANAREIYDFASPNKHLARLEISIDKGAHWTVVNEAIGTREPEPEG